MEDYKEAYHRERAARELTESFLEDKSRELYEINQELRLKQNQLIISEKMASLGQISAGIAHEINNPHSFILSNTSTLVDYFNDIFDYLTLSKSELDNIKDSDNLLLQDFKRKLDNCWIEKDFDFILSDITSILHENEEGLIRIRHIVDGLKGLSHSADNKSQHVNIKKCIETVLKVVHNETRGKCTVHLNVDKDYTVEGYQDQISQVFMNIIVNAVQAIQQDGKITISAQTIAESMVISIQDNGYGISPENLKKLFTPFFTTKPVGIGTGLGLSLCYEIVKAHDGKIEVDSAVGVGTTFKIWLPIKVSSSDKNANTQGIKIDG